MKYCLFVSKRNFCLCMVWVKRLVVEGVVKEYTLMGNILYEMHFIFQHCSLVRLIECNQPRIVVSRLISRKSNYTQSDVWITWCFVCTYIMYLNKNTRPQRWCNSYRKISYTGCSLNIIKPILSSGPVSEWAGKKYLMVHPLPNSLNAWTPHRR